MAKTISELRTSPHVGQPEMIFPLCLEGKLTAKVQILIAEIRELQAQVKALKPDDPDKGDPSATYGSAPAWGPAQKEIDEKTAELEQVRKQMEDSLAEVLLRAKQPGAWMDWSAAHPPRDDDPVDQELDVDVAAVLHALPEWVAEVSNEALRTGDAEWLMQNAGYGDLYDMALAVIRLQTGGIAVPKLSSGWIVDPTSDDD